LVGALRILITQGAYTVPSNLTTLSRLSAELMSDQLVHYILYWHGCIRTCESYWSRRGHDNFKM